LGGEVRRERERQAERRSDLRPEEAGAEDEERHFQAGAGYRANLAPVLGFEVREQLQHVLRERVRIARERAPQGVRGPGIGPGRTAETEIDAAGEERLERAEL